VLCAVGSPVTTLDCVLLEDKNLVFIVGLGPNINLRVSLSVLTGPRHITKCSLSTQRFIFLFYVLLRAPPPPKDGSGSTNCKQNRPLSVCRQFCCFVPQQVQGPNTAPLCAVVPNISRDKIQAQSVLSYPSMSRDPI
jgi:hypothetical protein